MTLFISPAALSQLQQHGEAAYPEEGAGLILGLDTGGRKLVTKLIMLDNTREAGVRHNRYLLKPEDYLLAETEAAKLGVDVLGVFHSHPDHPDQPSEFDRENALPAFTYIITSVNGGKAAGSRSWRLSENRTGFEEEPIEILG
ncbi:MAG: hypothetical protein A2Z16_05970 [Chloroflexi bacterium RBG_16_54_18]|nr:MAG: hypothetical protein A2Z16_05970 [Chloroflexi bacterium RBG_16_54_18]